MEKNLNEVRRIACITNNKTALDLTLGKPYNIKQTRKYNTRNRVCYFRKRSY